MAESFDAAKVITIDEDNDVTVFWDLAEAEACIERIDVSEGLYPEAFLDDGRVVTLAGGPDERVTAAVTDERDLDRLRTRLRQVDGPRHLADDPRAYAYEWLRLFDWASRKPLWRSRVGHEARDRRPRPERPDWHNAKR